MYGMSASSIKRGKQNKTARLFPDPNSKREKLYQAMMRDGFCIIEKHRDRNVLVALDRDYGIQTRSVGRRKYILVSTG